MASQENGNRKVSEIAENHQIADEADLLTEDHFREILQEKYGDFKIKSFNVKRALMNGENFASIMFRVNIEIVKKDGKIEEECFIVKLMPDNMFKETFKVMKAFTRELEMYEKIFPSFEEYFKTYNIDIRFGPKVFKYFEDPDIVIMEDLTRSGFKNINRQNGMDTTHIKATLSKLAKFHAASACIYEKCGSYSQQLTEGLYSEALMPFAQDFLGGLWSGMLKNSKEWDTLPEYIDKLAAYLPKVVELNREAVTRDPDAFNVLNHGDLWSNNIMFQYTETGAIKDLYFVDLQISVWSSPAIDLQYFLLSSAANDIRIKEFDSMIKFYHDELISNLKILEYTKPLPKLIDLHIDILKRGFYGLFTAAGVLGAALADASDDATAENFFSEVEGSENMKKSLFTNQRYKEAIKILLPFLANRGLLDL